jgi:carbon storage regulator
MLVLSRRKNQTIVIGHNIRVTVARIDRDKVRLAIHAPGLPIWRDEILLAQQQSTQPGVSKDDTNDSGRGD